MSGISARKTCWEYPIQKYVWNIWHNKVSGMSGQKCVRNLWHLKVSGVLIEWHHYTAETETEEDRTEDN